MNSLANGQAHLTTMCIMALCHHIRGAFRLKAFTPRPQRWLLTLAHDRGDQMTVLVKPRAERGKIDQDV